MDRIVLKKYTYITGFTLMGVLVSFILHGLIELLVIELLLTDFQRFNLGIGWDGWFRIHAVGGTVLFLVCAGLGLQQGVYWWSAVYENKEK
jgi:hypothetical protein